LPLHATDEIENDSNNEAVRILAATLFVVREYSNEFMTVPPKNCE
jgi:hypothetical protein